MYLYKHHYEQPSKNGAFRKMMLLLNQDLGLLVPVLSGNNEYLVLYQSNILCHKQVVVHLIC